METRNKIIEKASELFLVMGVKNITMDQIASEAGVSKRTIYELFKDKDDLVIQSLREMIIYNNKQMLGIIAQAQHVIEAIFMIIKRETMHRKGYTRIFIEDIRKYYSRVNESLYSCKESLKEFSASYTLLEKGIREDIFRKDIQIELVDNFLHELMNLMERSDRIKALNPMPEDILRSIFLPYLRGICTAKGVKLMDQYFENITELI
ncbi:MAG: TetR/AcrR family transcriptional regulator [Lentimicrobium sp.]|jgi:AcrR family transcriptional regulator|nr:TetR/AcrR family transcriptional regulator [Lentimicrobium sp.]MDD4597572.1 TetR/AcrR family transcriptional regulator [Lentimicrobiaceae bacterium]MDY0026614.1 TetR/AcrR family transcriptional regulator [Lentimicrobium sp.]